MTLFLPDTSLPETQLFRLPNLLPGELRWLTSPAATLTSVTGWLDPSSAPTPFMLGYCEPLISILFMRFVLLLTRFQPSWQNPTRPLVQCKLKTSCRFCAVTRPFRDSQYVCGNRSVRENIGGREKQENLRLPSITSQQATAKKSFTLGRIRTETVMLNHQPKINGQFIVKRDDPTRRNRFAPGRNRGQSKSVSVEHALWHQLASGCQTFAL